MPHDPPDPAQQDLSSLNSPDDAGFAFSPPNLLRYEMRRDKTHRDQPSNSSDPPGVSSSNPDPGAIGPVATRLVDTGGPAANVIGGPATKKTAQPTLRVGAGRSPKAGRPPNNKPGPQPENTVTKRGRPTSFDDRERRDFCTMITLGCSARAAAGHLGFDRKTIEYARRRSPEFDAEVRLAEQSRNLAALRNVVAAGQRSWRASAWLLGSVQPELYDARRRRNRADAGMSKTRLKKLVTQVVKEVLPTLFNERGKSAEHVHASNKPADPDAQKAIDRIDQRLAEIDAQCNASPYQPEPILNRYVPDERDREAIAKNIARLKNRLAKKYGLHRKLKPAKKKR